MPGNLINPALVSGTTYIVRPSDQTAHLQYIFYTKILATGGSNAYFGSYILNVGCYVGSVEYTDADDLITSILVLVGDPAEDIYTFNQPTSDKTWCIKTKNSIVNPDEAGTAWRGATKIKACSS